MFWLRMTMASTLDIQKRDGSRSCQRLHVSSKTNNSYLSLLAPWSPWVYLHCIQEASSESGWEQVCVVVWGQGRVCPCRGPSWEKCTLKGANVWMFGCRLEDFFRNLSHSLSVSICFKTTSHSFLHTTPDTMTLLPDTKHTHMHKIAHGHHYANIKHSGPSCTLVSHMVINMLQVCLNCMCAETHIHAQGKCTVTTFMKKYSS